jgi:hypothetical protein
VALFGGSGYTRSETRLGLLARFLDPEPGNVEGRQEQEGQAPLPYVAMQQMFDPAFPPGRLNYWKSGLANRLTDEAIEAAVEYAMRAPSPHTALLFAELHGAYSRVSKTETAYFHRDLQYDLIILSGWTDPADTQCNIDWTRELFAAWEPHLARAAYVNDLGDEGEDRARSAYGGNYPRLAALKAKYDPTNLFRLNQNIEPTA